MLTPGLANLCISCSAVWFGSLGGLRGTFGSGLGVLRGVESSQSSWELATLWWYRNAGSTASKPVLAQHFVLGGLPDLSGHISVAD